MFFVAVFHHGFLFNCSKYWMYFNHATSAFTLGTLFKRKFNHANTAFTLGTLFKRKVSELYTFLYLVIWISV